MNESVHANIWILCQKIQFCRYYRVKFAVQVTILNHNVGYEKGNLMTKLLGTNEAIQKNLRNLDNEKSRHEKNRKKENQKKIKEKVEKSNAYMSGGF